MVCFLPQCCVTVFVKTGVERGTNSEEVKHDCVGASVVFLMWRSVVITEITNLHSFMLLYFVVLV